MAKPDCDDGWLKYAHELDAALAVADFTKGARIVLREVFAQIFGPAKLKTARISAVEIGAKIGRPKQYIDRGVTELVDSNVLQRTPDGRFRFLKDYESWIYCPRTAKDESEWTPRFTSQELRYIRNAPADAHSHKNASVINSVDASTDAKSTKWMTDKRPAVNRMDDQRSTGWMTESTNGLTRDRLSVNRMDDDRSTNGLTGGNPPPNNPPNRSELETLETVVVVRGREADDPNLIRCPEHQATVDLARELFGDEFAATVLEMGGDILHSLGERWDCYQAAMKQAKRSRGGIDNLHVYCIRTAGRFAVDRIPPKPVAYRPEQRDTPSPATISMTAAQAKLHAQSIAIRNANSANNPALIAIEGE